MRVIVGYRETLGDLHIVARLAVSGLDTLKVYLDEDDPRNVDCVDLRSVEDGQSATITMPPGVRVNQLYIEPLPA